MFDIAIIGGGAAGLMAAAECLNDGYSVAVLEGSDRIGKKILATGNGKCNLTHKTIDIAAYNTCMIKPILDRFTPQAVVKKFEDMGLLTRLINDNYYPYSEQATSLLAVLRTAVSSAKIMTNVKVVKVQAITDGYILHSEQGEKILAKRVCFACGSRATMGIDSMQLITDLGYKIKPMRPSLLPILAERADIKGMQGVRCKVAATIEVGGNVAKACGEILFKDNALSGIVSFCLSAHLSRSPLDNCIVTIDFAPEYTMEQLQEVLSKIGIDNMYHKSIVTALQERAIKVGGMAKAIKGYDVVCKVNKDINSAQVMSGGIELSQVDLNNMSLKGHRGLYAIGEALDVDGECGGYNLHWAWASAMAFAEGLRYAK